MIQLRIDRIPGGRESTETLRHWIVFEDGRIFYQDETIDYAKDESERTEWIALPTPPVYDVAVHVAEHHGCLTAVMRSGKVYVWVPLNPENDLQEQEFQHLLTINQRHRWPHQWVEIPEPVPGTVAFAEYNQ
jgi:hypothetical protein